MNVTPIKSHAMTRLRNVPQLTAGSGPDSTDIIVSTMIDIPGAPSGQKAKKEPRKEKPKEKQTGTQATTERTVTGVYIDPKDRVQLNIVEIITIAPQDFLTGESTIKYRNYKMSSDDKAHPDLISALKMCRKYALEICEIDVPDDKKKFHAYQVMGLKIAGDLLLKQARVTFDIGKLVKRTSKIVKIKTPQTTLYGQSEYENADKLAPLVERVIAEAVEYMYGKYEESNPHQMEIFPR